MTERGTNDVLAFESRVSAGTFGLVVGWGLAAALIVGGAVFIRSISGVEQPALVMGALVFVAIAAAFTTTGLVFSSTGAWRDGKVCSRILDRARRGERTLLDADVAIALWSNYSSGPRVLRRLRAEFERCEAGLGRSLPRMWVVQTAREGGRYEGTAKPAWGGPGGDAGWIRGRPVGLGFTRRAMLLTVLVFAPVLVEIALYSPLPPSERPEWALYVAMAGMAFGLALLAWEECRVVYRVDVVEGEVVVRYRDERRRVRELARVSLAGALVVLVAPDRRCANWYAYVLPGAPSKGLRFHVMDVRTGPWAGVIRAIEQEASQS